MKLANILSPCIGCTIHCTDPMTLGFRQGSSWTSSVDVTSMTRLERMPGSPTFEADALLLNHVFIQCSVGGGRYR